MSHISVLQKEINWLNGEKENHIFGKTPTLTCKTPSKVTEFTDKHMKWSHGHYRQFAPDGFPQTHDKRTIVYLICTKCKIIIKISQIYSKKFPIVPCFSSKSLYLCVYSKF